MSHYLGGLFGLAIIALTIVVNLCLLPFTLKQIRATVAMQALQPKMAELQKKYAKDKQRLAQEQMKLYKETGMNPAGCLIPMLIQLPIWIALYQSIMMTLAVAPEGLLNLSRYLYSWPIVYSSLPLSNSFLGLDLASPNIILAILVGATMWIQQKMSMPPVADPSQRSQSQMMLWMMPLMFTFLASTFPSGLALFWVTSSIVRIAMQYYSSGWGGLVRTSTTKPSGRDQKFKKKIASVEGRSLTVSDISADIVETSSTPEEGLDYGQSGDKRPDIGGGYKASLRAIRRQSGRSRDQRRKRR